MSCIDPLRTLDGRVDCPRAAGRKAVAFVSVEVDDLKVLLVTIGSLGDLHPFIAIGRALRTAGATVTLAVPLDHVAKVEAAGLAASAILPSFSEIGVRLGITEADTAARVIADPHFVLDHVLLPSLADSTTALDALADGMDVIVGSIFAFSAGIVSEKRGLPLVDVVLQPMTMFSVWDPPRAPRFEAMRHAPNGPVGRGWNRVLYRIMRQALRGRHGAVIDSVRHVHGLAPSRDAPLIDRPATRAQTLCCYSPMLGLPCLDAPPDTHVVGFPLFDSERGNEEALDPKLSAFLAQGEPPLVFSLGSFAWAAAGDFYQQAATAARHLGRRAVLLTGTGGFNREGDCVSIGYPGIEHEKSANWSIVEAGMGLSVPPYEDYARYWRNSPLAYVAGVETPLLLIHGEFDKRGALSQADTFFYSLYRQGKTARLLRYWGENHSLSQSPANMRNVLSETISWFDRYVPPATTIQPLSR